ncbi:transcriptional regulator GlxA family with amidase domain [Spinactinospora alkalitolerans]|uniref:Transcriptional regulator GlxA family with amidase domain n=1 Tax=Spinactinospora alkalitolerans TaxID=687207 RepID=A0A852TW47_9ACTN|nr:DJ-1/PfpI family protein [Spinactinospora alkalitolerans]NYE47951.1 transcriptional regulator GlxA family with amidase domain [Spinactinospora alkalitolerans]
MPHRPAGPGPQHVTVFAFEGVRLMDLSAPLEVFTTAAQGSGSYTVQVCTPDGQAIRTSAGLRIEADLPADRVERTDLLVVPGPAHVSTLAQHPALTDHVARLAARSRRVASVCTGAFLLAAAGLLCGRRATTHWEHASDLARRYPDTAVTPDAIYIQDGPVFTSAGVTAGIDLCLALVEGDHGAREARRVARDLVVFLQRPGGQSQFSAASRTPVTRHPALRPVLDRIAADPAADHSPHTLAKQAGLSPRHLTRLFKDQAGTTPAAYVETIRLEAARILLERGETVTAAARQSGLGSDETLRRAFARHLGTTPSAYLARFRTARTGADFGVGTEKLRV